MNSIFYTDMFQTEAAISFLNTPDTIQVGFKVRNASFCILARAPFIEFLDKLVVVRT
jgi:hypothetical protein